MTGAEFRALIERRGYSLSDVARRWGLSAARVCQLASTDDRPRHYDDAVWSLPVKAHARTVGKRRGRIVRALVGGAASEDRAVLPEWAVVGMEFMVHSEQGDHLRERARGYIVTIDGTEVLIKFASGYVETFSVPYLESSECFLACTGRVVETNALTK